MKSDIIKKALSASPQGFSCYATGIPKVRDGKTVHRRCNEPLTDLIAGHAGMRDLERFIEKAFIQEEGTLLFRHPGICDGIAMGTAACTIPRVP